LLAISRKEIRSLVHILQKKNKVFLIPVGTKSSRLACSWPAQILHYRANRQPKKMSAFRFR
jgi:hypothetical protein